MASKQGPLEPLAHLGLEGRPGFKLVLRVVGERWLIYVTHLWHSGWSIVDVTDPARPRLERFIPGPANTWTLQITVHGDLVATSLERIQPGWGGAEGQPHEDGIQLWDVSDPVAPVSRGRFRTGGAGTHRNGFDSQGLLHASAWVEGFDGAIYLLVDPSDPDRPREIGRFFLEEQASPAGERLQFGLHGPGMRVADTVFLPYSESGLVVLDISNPEQPRMVGRLPVHPPLGSEIAVHTVVPLPARGLAVINSEALQEHCAEPPNFAAMVDISEREWPRMVSLFPTPQPPPGAAFSSFCELGGRFGPHNQHMPSANPNLLQSDTLCFLTYFNAGLRVYDTSDPLHVREVAWMIPRDPTERIGRLPRELAVQVEDVLVDARGVVYLTEKNSGLYIARWGGPTAGERAERAQRSGP